MSPNGEFAEKLQAAVSRHLGRSAEIDELSRLTGGATKTTWRFDAIAGAERLPLILQLSEPVELAP
ncbi:MAG: phosphotransferase family protein, partial [bacterium]